MPSSATPRAARQSRRAAAAAPSPMPTPVMPTSMTSTATSSPRPHASFKRVTHVTRMRARPFHIPALRLLALLALVFVLLSLLSLPLQTPPPRFNLVPQLRRWTHPAYARARLRVFVYPLPTRFHARLVQQSRRNPGRIRDPRCDTNFYSSEMHVHHFLLNSSVRTHDPHLADFFYVPVYTTCHLITVDTPDMHVVASAFADAMRIVTHDYPYWNRSNGRDHVYLFAQGFGARLAGDWKPFKNGIFMVHNGEFSALEYTPHKDFTIPPDIRAYFEPYWLERHRTGIVYPNKFLAQLGGQVVRSSVSDFRGSNYSGGVRQYIQKHFTHHPDYRITGVRSETYITDMKSSKFCLAPEGWHPWSPRPYYAVLLGCIPVIISEVQELAFEEFVDWDSFAVWVRPSDIAKLDAILRSFSDAEIQRRRRAMEAVWRAFWYPGDGLAFQGILRSLYLRKYDSSPRRYFSHV